ncbi:MAG: FAD-dependent oxidoreductase [Betaproteobacteria bacterium]|nr:FAD-dependent oxidoreductase [Betaproteobacteria bacterium]
MAGSERDFDVIVVGGGGGGLAAATVAAAEGARVLVVDADKKLGGSTSLSTGVFYAAGTSVQRMLGIEDNPADQYRYYMNVNQHKLEASVVHRLCHDSGPTLEWLLSLGVEFKPGDLYCSGVDGIPRGHMAAGHGASIAAALEGSFTGKTVDVVLNTRVQELLVEGGRVAGIQTADGPVRAGAVVISTGGFGNNRRMLAELYPDAARQGDAAWYIGSKHSKGDGLNMGRAVGADIAGYNRGLLLLTTGFVQELESHLPGWLVYVNREGRRFVDEYTEYSVLAEVLREQLAGECFAIFDEATRATAKAPNCPNWTPDRLDHFIKSKQINSAPTLAELADLVGVRAETLATTIENYNADCDAGQDTWFFKEKKWLQAVRKPPFFAAPIRPQVVCWTGTGLRIDREARVLNKADRHIAGLFAAGEATGGMFGECYAAGGASIGNAVTYGRVAGRNAARFAGH